MITHPRDPNILPFGYFVGRVGILSSRDGIKGFVWKLKLEAILRRPFDYILYNNSTVEVWDGKVLSG